MQRFAAIIVLSVVAAAIAGCGGSGDSNTVTTSSLSKAEFTKKANALCEEARQEALAYRLPAGEEESPEAVTTTVHKGILPPIQRVMEEVRELGAPKGDEEKVEAILVGNEEAIEKAEGMKFSSMSDMEEVFLPTAEKARGYGVDNCGY